MSADGVTPPSRPSNGSNPAQAVSGPNAGDSDSPARPSDLPTVRERVRGLLEAHPEKMWRPISEEHGRRLRVEALQEPEEWESEVTISNDIDGYESWSVRETTSRGALPLVAVVEEMLEWYEGYRDKKLRMARGDGVREERESFLVDLENSFQPGYQARTYARLQALRRQTAGGEYPDGSECEGEYEEPVTVLFGLTSSGVDGDGSPRPIVDHDREIREAWTGSSGSVKRTLRYVLEDKLGLSSEEYAWWWQAEPHPGDGKNAGYSHSHPVVVLDAAGADVEAEQITAETFRAAVAKHVAETPGATWEAHGLDQAVTVKQPGEVEDFASYVSEYLAVSPDQDLLERSDEYLMWAASMWASTSQKYSKSKTATAALAADRCHQQYADPEASQDEDHGEAVERVDGERRCAWCGESFGVDQSGTLAGRRLQEPATDGGAVVEEEPESDVSELGLEDVEERWPSARAAAVAGSETREAGEEPEWTVRASFGPRPPSWEPEAVVHTSTGEESRVGKPGGVAYGEVVVEGAESVGAKVDRDVLMPAWLEGERPWESSPVTEEEVRSGEVPPPEVVAKEYAERVQSGRRLTPKEWREDWYARRYEHGGVEEEPEPFEEERVREYVRVHEPSSAVAVLAQLEISPEHRGKVEAILGE